VPIVCQIFARKAGHTDFKAKDPFNHSNMEQKHAHVLWKPTATAVMVAVLLSSLATAEVRGDTNLSLEKMQQNKPQFEHGQGAHERQEKMTAAGSMIMTPTIRVFGKYSKIQMVEEAYCQGFDHYHIGEIAELMQ